jgi:hypothetical protein
VCLSCIICIDVSMITIKTRMPPIVAHHVETVPGDKIWRIQRNERRASPWNWMTIEFYLALCCTTLFCSPAAALRFRARLMAL